MRKGVLNGSARKSSANYQRQKKVDVTMTSTFFMLSIKFILHYPKKDSNIPAATAEPITPATLGPMACINRKLEGLAS